MTDIEQGKLYRLTVTLRGMGIETQNILNRVCSVEVLGLVQNKLSEGDYEFFGEGVYSSSLNDWTIFLESEPLEEATEEQPISEAEVEEIVQKLYSDVEEATGGNGEKSSRVNVKELIEKLAAKAEEGSGCGLEDCPICSDRGPKKMRMELDSHSLIALTILAGLPRRIALLTGVSQTLVDLILDDMIKQATDAARVGNIRGFERRRDEGLELMNSIASQLVRKGFPFRLMAIALDRRSGADGSISEDPIGEIIAKAPMDSDSLLEGAKKIVAEFTGDFGEDALDLEEKPQGCSDFLWGVLKGAKILISRFEGAPSESENESKKEDSPAKAEV